MRNINRRTPTKLNDTSKPHTLIYLHIFLGNKKTSLTIYLRLELAKLQEINY